MLVFDVESFANCIIWSIPKLEKIQVAMTKIETKKFSEITHHQIEQNNSYVYIGKIISAYFFDFLVC